MENGNKEPKKEKKGFLSTLLNKIRPGRKAEKDEKRKKSGTGGTF